ncbi:MAG: hypothetical protein MUF49_05785 [Oculatellaceae cyanobacterium Prado106]|jgi:hypothetical protein|nr:hypothetical protein [Oculatellaceae cyanobacterium Prado106]
MPCPFDLDKPLLEQHSVREMFQEPLESVSVEVILDKFHEIAHLAILNELLNSGIEESEFPQICLTLEKPQAPENLAANELDESINFASQESNADAGDADSPQLPVSEEFVRRLMYRLDEAAKNSSFNLQEEPQLSVDFGTISLMSGTRPCCEGRYAYKDESTTECNFGKACRYVKPDREKPVES